jgi:hypothetical protein
MRLMMDILGPTMLLWGGKLSHEHCGLSEARHSLCSFFDSMFLRLRLPVSAWIPTCDDRDAFY